MACCGVVDVILYLSTRKALVKSSVGIRGGNDNENLTRFRSRDSTARRRGESMMMGGLGRSASQAEGRIMVEREVVMSEGPKNSQVSVKKQRESVEERSESRAGSMRSDSLRSLVGKKEEGSWSPQ